jgi:hypothetical protein
MKYDDARSLETVPPNIVERDYGCGDQLKDPKPGETVRCFDRGKKDFLHRRADRQGEGSLHRGRDERHHACARPQLPEQSGARLGADVEDLGGRGPPSLIAEIALRKVSSFTGTAARRVATSMSCLFLCLRSPRPHALDDRVLDCCHHRCARSDARHREHRTWRQRPADDPADADERRRRPVRPFAHLRAHLVCQALEIHPAF